MVASQLIWLHSLLEFVQSPEMIDLFQMIILNILPSVDPENTQSRIRRVFEPYLKTWRFYHVSRWKDTRHNRFFSPKTFTFFLAVQTNWRLVW